MPRPTFRRALILGGIRSGKSEFAESLLATVLPVRYVATARRDPADQDWEARIEAHRARRPGTWATSDVGDDPLALPELLKSAGPHDALIVDDLGTWVAAVTEIISGRTANPVRFDTILGRLAAGIRASPATLVLVSPEVGLSVVPATAAGRTFADALGTTNRTVAAECDVVTLVIAGNAVPVKGGL